MIIGHRGWRGKYPENSLLGFEELAKAGVNAVELDVVVTQEGELLVSHEAHFDAQYCNTKYPRNLSELTAAEIQKVDCGSKLDPRFPHQLKVKTVKPTFKELITLWERLGVKPFIALEVKSESRLYGYYQPFPTEFAQIVKRFEEKYLVGYDYFIQSFDPYFLKSYHAISGATPTGLLVEYAADFKTDIGRLGYLPDFYNPDHVLLTPDLVNEVKDHGVGIYTWTVNEPKDYDRLLPLGLRGVITDYPERFG